ncbi:MAG: type II toxin-antitoxin system PemK/MazF family toxin [Proteobacteria bacterium]|jgi:mRNA interferase MazF|nr:type II toxin-antitoxin system PemK/MazF family toxin [Pseudomonadota bacterium]
MILPERGSIVWLEFSPHAGHEQAGRRPAIVLTPRVYHARTHKAVVCPITNKERGWPLEVKLPPGLAVSGVVLVDEIRSVDRAARYMKVVGTAPQTVLDEINAKLVPFLNL